VRTHIQTTHIAITENEYIKIQTRHHPVNESRFLDLPHTEGKNNGIWLIQFPLNTTFEIKHLNIDSTVNFSQTRMTHSCITLSDEL
jgi:hypothetical protein